jgi:hypothetical protein
MSEEHVQTCKYVCFSTICEEVFTKDHNDDFDAEEFAGLLGNSLGWGDANRTMVSLSRFCDCVRSVTLDAERCEAICQEISKIVPHDVYIDMES